MKKKQSESKRELVLWCALLITAALVVALGCYLKYAVCRPLGVYQEESVLTLPFVLLSREGRETLVEELTRQAVTEPPAQPSTEPPTDPPTDPTVREPTVNTAPRFDVPVYGEDEHYFDDVLFIGDSRTCGLRDYARLGEADYFCSVGMTVFSALKTTASDVDFSGTDLMGLLGSRTYGKIYISLGINECGYPLEDLMDTYSSLVEKVREAQPGAVIVLNSIMTVGREKAASASYFHIDNIQRVNSRIAELANDTSVFYLDVNQAFADDEGYLPDALSADGCHLYGKYYADWAEWLCVSVEQLNAKDLERRLSVTPPLGRTEVTQRD